MKYLLLFLIPLNIWAYDYAEINSWTVDGKIGYLLNRHSGELVPRCRYTYSATPHTYASASLFVCTQDQIDQWGCQSEERVECAIPELSVLEALLVIYKAEETAKEDARLAEIARQQGLWDRVNTMLSQIGGYPNMVTLFKRNGMNVPNPEKRIREIINDPAREHRIDEIEARVALYLSDKDTEQSEHDADKVLRQAIRDFTPATFDALPAGEKWQLVKKLLRIKKREYRNE